jgi:glycosyltransferase involved in cell wall biosynthesis
VKLVVYIPALNEEQTIQEVVARLPKKMPGIDRIERLVVDDGSTDETAGRANSAGARVVSHNKNRGVGAAFQTALQYALENGADLLVGIDGDGQFDPGEIPVMVAALLDGRADLVVGNRFVSGRPENMPGLKYWGNRQVANLVSALCGQRFRDVSCGFRAYGREAMLRSNVFADFTYTHETILALVFQGCRVHEQPVRVRYVQGRRSRVAGSVLRYAIQTSKIILRALLDYRPMRVFGTLGGVFMGVGAAFELFLLGFYLFAGTFSPYKSTGFIGLGFIVFGMLTLLMALIADMLNRMRRNQDRMLYEMKKMRYGQ